MERRPSFSPSRLTTYLACPHKYWWSYINPRGKWFLRSKSTFSFGLSLHKVLERFHDSGGAGVQTIDQALSTYEESWVDAGYTSAEEMAEAFGEGKEIIERYVDEHSVPRVGVKTIAIEKLFRQRRDTHDLVGRVDRLDEHDDGLLEVVDYKTGRETVAVEEVASDISLSLYQLLVSKEYPGKRTAATLYAVRTGASASYEMSPQELSDFEFEIGELTNQILCHEWAEMPPVRKSLCATCDFLKLCQKHPDFEA